MKVGIKKQKGAFSVEAAFSFLVLAGLTLFLLDLSAQTIMKSQAERVSYSLVNIIKERSRFFEGRANLHSVDVDTLHNILDDLLYLPIESKQKGVGLVVESLVEGGTQVYKRGYKCQAQRSIGTLTSLVPVDKEGDSFPIYQVTVCIEMDGVFGLMQGLRIISSSSVMPGR